jgi:hypothetical protein
MANQVLGAVLVNADAFHVGGTDELQTLDEFICQSGHFSLWCFGNNKWHD